MMKIPISEAVNQMTLTVEVQGIRTFSVRLWLGQFLIKLAARVIGCKVRIGFDGSH